MKKLLFTLVSACMLTAVFSQVGSLDPTYGDNGIKVIVPPVPPPTGPPLKTYPADEGGYYAIFHDCIVKYLKDGTVDVMYGNSGFVVFSKSINKSFDLEGTVRQADGRITVVGNAGDGIDIIRYHADGTLDFYEKFGNYGELEFYSKYVETVTLQDDKVVITGTQQQFHPNFLLYFVYVLYPTGGIEDLSPDYRFFTTDFSIIDGNEHFIYEGWLTNPHPPITYILGGTNTSFFVGPIEYSEDVYEEEGLIIHNFTIDNNYTPPVFPDDVYTPVFTSVRKVVLSPVLNPATGSQDFLVTVYKDDGMVDESFGNKGSVQIDFGGEDVPTAFIWQGTKLIVGGNSTDPATGKTSFAIVRLNSNGTPDPLFDGDGKQLTYREGLFFNLQRLAIQDNGKTNRLLAVGENVIAAYILDEAEAFTLSCPAGIIVPTDAGTCTAVVNGLDPVVTPAGAEVTYTLSGATVGSGTGTVSGKIFNQGQTTVTYTLTGDPAQTCSFTVTVKDEEAPVISNLSTNVTTIWPPNHKMVDVWVGYTLNDNCGATSALTVSSNEPQTSADPEDKSPDWIVLDAHRVQLRAERLGSGTGRIYTITLTATDPSGNATQQSIAVTVPKSKGKNGNPAVRLGNEVVVKELLVSVLPNPSASHFNLVLQSKNQKAITLRVLDALGRVVETRSNLGAGTIQLGSYYKAGVYQVEVMQGNERVAVSLVKL